MYTGTMWKDIKWRFKQFVVSFFHKKCEKIVKLI